MVPHWAEGAILHGEVGKVSRELSNPTRHATQTLQEKQNLPTSAKARSLEQMAGFEEAVWLRGLGESDVRGDWA